MTRWLLCVPVVFLASFAQEAQAGITLSASVGQGYQITEPRGGAATNVMIAPGVGLGELLRLELGIAGSLDAARAGQSRDLHLELRPMLVLAPPLLPVYGRLVVAANRPFSDDRVMAYGGALGFQIGLGGLGLFAEAGILPRLVADNTLWGLEGRLGFVYYM